MTPIELMEKLRGLASRELLTDSKDFDPMEMDRAGFDYCYSQGMEDGVTKFARMILLEQETDGGFRRWQSCSKR